MKRFRRVAIADFVNAVKEWGPGIYIAGLDVHVGFIVNTGGEVYFVHSSYVDPYTVIKEKQLNPESYRVSNYRVVGKRPPTILITNWLLGKPVPTRVMSANRGSSN